ASTRKAAPRRARSFTWTRTASGTTRISHGRHSRVPNGSRARAVVGIIAVTAALRLALAARLGLSVDESYAVVMSRRLALSYYDHPPLLFWIPGMVARLFGSEAPL